MRYVESIQSLKIINTPVLYKSLSVEVIAKIESLADAFDLWVYC